MDTSFALDCNFLLDESVVACRKCWQISLLEDTLMVFFFYLRNVLPQEDDICVNSQVFKGSANLEQVKKKLLVHILSGVFIRDIFLCIVAKSVILTKCQGLCTSQHAFPPFCFIFNSTPARPENCWSILRPWLPLADAPLEMVKWLHSKGCYRDFEE